MKFLKAVLAGSCVLLSCSFSIVRGSEQRLTIADRYRHRVRENLPKEPLTEMKARISELQGIDNQNLNLLLMKFFSPAQDKEVRELFPDGCIPAVFGAINAGKAVDEKKADVEDVLKRINLLYAQGIKNYAAYRNSKDVLSKGNLTPEQYTLAVNAFVEAGRSFFAEYDFLLIYAKRGVEDLKSKWGEESDIDLGLVGAIEVIEAVIRFLEVQRATFRLGHKIAHIRYCTRTDGQIEPAELWELPEHRALVAKFEESSKTEEAAAADVYDKFLNMAQRNYFHSAWISFIPKMQALPEEASEEA